MALAGHNVVLVVLEVLVVVVATVDVVVVVVGQTQDGDGDAELDGLLEGLASPLAEGDGDGFALFEGLALFEGFALFEGLALLLTDGDGEGGHVHCDGDTDGLGAWLAEFDGEGEALTDGLADTEGAGSSVRGKSCALAGNAEARRDTATSRANLVSI